MSFDIVKTTLAANLAPNGTLALGYPAGRSKGNYAMCTGDGHVVMATGYGKFVSPKDFTLTFGANAAGITLTWASTSPQLAAGTALSIQIDRKGENDFQKESYFPKAVNQQAMFRGYVDHIDLGSPNALSTTAIINAATVAAAGAVALNGGLVSNGVVTNDVARGCQIVSSNAGDTAKTVTITGTDIFGAAMTEAITANGTTPVFGLKAFKTITGATASAAFTGTLSVGQSDVLGLPVFLPTVGQVLKELQDGAVATAGTIAAGSVAKATSTTGDVRGTYKPNAATDGSKGFILIAALLDPNDVGVTQA